MNADAQQRPEPQIRLELTRLLFKAMPTSVWGTLLGILFCTIILWPTVGSYQLAAWTCIFLSWTVLRTWHTRRFESSKFSERETSTPWLAQFSVGALGAALCWAATSIWLFPIHQPVYQVVLAFMLITTCAVAITSLSPNRPLATTFLCIVLLPLIVRFSIHSSEIHLLMGLMSGFALILLIVSVQRINATTVENVALRLQAQQSEQDISASQQKLTLHRRSNPLAVIEWDTEFKITD